MILVPSLTDIDSISKSDAEKRVARLLAGVDSDNNAVAFFSVGLRSHQYKQQAEADFVILWRDVVVVVEVKGGGVEKSNGVWHSVDRRGNWHRLKTSPMEQAQSAAYALRDILTQEKIDWYPYEAVVITPDIDSPPHSIDTKTSHWWARSAMTTEGLTNALDDAVSKSRRAPQYQKIARTSDLRNRLFGEFVRMPVRDGQRGAVIEEQNRATAGQSRVLAALAKNDRVLVIGGAGTGKSLVLVEAAKQEADRGLSVLVTFKSPKLSEFFSPYLVDQEVDVIPFDDLPTSKAYDAVLVDEAQDMMTAEAMDRLDTVINGGRGKGRWRMFLDPNNQAHVDGNYDPEVAELVASEAVTVELSLNVRNTRSIVEMVQNYLGADVGDPGIVHGELVEWHTVGKTASLEDAARIAGNIASNGVSRDNIWIIDPRSTAEPSTKDGVIVTSPRYAKGLEVDYVVVCGLPDDLDAAGTAAFYVAVTRARVSLHLIMTRSDRQRILQIIKQGQGI